jgi:hypothetical protein
MLSSRVNLLESGAAVGEETMNRDANEKLRLDRRLLRRRGWISEAELDQALTELPDVSHKIAPPESEEGEGPATPQEPPRAD